MGIDIAGGVIDRLKSDNAFLATLGVYEPDDAEPTPAIFTDPTPPDFEVDVKPAIIVGEPWRDDPDDDLTHNGRDVSLRVRIFVKHNGSGIAINDVAQDARALLHNWSTPSFSTGRLLASFVSGPVNGPTSDPSIEGRILNLRLLIRE